MRTIYKYEIPVTDTLVLQMPEGARPLPYLEVAGVGRLRLLTFWAEVDTDQPQVGRVLHVEGTGHPVADGATFIGTARDGVFMWHLYDGGQK